MQRINVFILVSCFYLYAVNLVDVFVASVAQSSVHAPFTSEIVGSILATDSCQRSAESRGFSPHSSHRES
jgi:hypothetical protein